MGDNKKGITKWLQLFLFSIAVILVYKTLDNLSAIGIWIKNLLDVLMPFLVGILIAYLLYVPSKKLENLYLKAKKSKLLKKWARPLAIFTVYTIVIIILIMSFNFLIPVVVNSIIDCIFARFCSYKSCVTNCHIVIL